jgi:hypothetical protein
MKGPEGMRRGTVDMKARDALCIHDGLFEARGNREE